MGEQEFSEPEVHRIDSFDAWFSYLLQEAGVRHGEADTDWTWPDENYEETRWLM